MQAKPIVGGVRCPVAFVFPEELRG